MNAGGDEYLLFGTAPGWANPGAVPPGPPDPPPGLPWTDGSTCAGANFGQADGTNMNGLATDSGSFTWATWWGGWEVRSGQAHPTATTINAIVVPLASHNPVTVTGYFSLGYDGTLDSDGLIALGTDANNFLFARISGAGYLEIWEMVSGTPVLRNNVSYPAGTGVVYAMTLSVSGTTATVAVSINGSTKGAASLTASSVVNTGNHVGLYSFRSNSGTTDIPPNAFSYFHACPSSTSNVGPPTITATAGVGQVTVNWSAVAGSGATEVYYGLSSAGPWTYFGLSTSTSEAVTGLTGGTLYYFKTNSVPAGGGSDSVDSNVVSATPAVLPAPTISSTVGNTKITVSWTAITGAASYKVYFSASSSSGPWTLFGGTAGVSEVVTGLTNGTTYWFKVNAVDGGGGVSANSNVITAMPLSSGNIILDTFTDTPGTDVSSHVPDVYLGAGQGWAQSVSGRLQISGNALVTTSGSGSIAVCTIPVGQAGNYTIEADVTSPASGAWACWLLANSFATYPGAGPPYQALGLNFNSGSNYLGLESYTSGSSGHTDASTTFTWAPSVTHTLRMVLGSTTIAIYVDGVLISALSSSGFTANPAQTAAGIQIENYGGACTFDNFKVY